MKKTLLSMMALMMVASPVLAAVPEGVQVEPILSVSSQNQEFLTTYGIFQEYTIGGSPISRAEAVKILVNYLKKSEGETAFADRADHTYQCGFTDISKLDTETQNVIKNSCSHGLFKGNSKQFRPNDDLTWAEMLAVLSRMSNENIKEGNPRWEGYYTLAIRKNWVTTSDRSKMDWKITKENFAKVLYAYDTSKGNTTKINDQDTVKTSLSNSTWELQLFDGKAVSGAYTLEFKDNTLHTKFCNNINGTYTIDGNKLNAMLVSTEMACLDEETMNLEGKFNLMDATFAIASTKMVSNNIERLAIKTKDGHTFTYIKTETMVGGDKDAHGCIPSAGYSWNEAAQECQRPWEHKNPLADTEWKLSQYNGKAVSGAYTLSFTNDKVHTQFCNVMNGSYSTSWEKITGKLASTMMLCNDEEKMMLENNFIIENATFGIASTRMVSNNIEILAITTKDGNIYTWSKVIKNTEWNPRDVLDGREFGLRSLNGEAVNGEYLIIFGDGKLSTKFCNTINGSYSIDDNGKMSGTLISTLMACLDGESSKLEPKFAIDGATVKVDGDSFTLTTKNNDIFVWHAIYR